MANKKLWTITGSLAIAALLTTSAGLATADNQSPESPSSTTVTTPTSPQKQNSAPSVHTASRITSPAPESATPEAPAKVSSAPSAQEVKAGQPTKAAPVASTTTPKQNDNSAPSPKSPRTPVSPVSPASPVSAPSARS